MTVQLSIPDQLRRQAGWCESLGSDLYIHLLQRCAEDYEQGGPLLTLLSSHENDPESSVLALRLMGAVHRLVLEGRAPELAQYYPSVGGVVELQGAWRAFRSVVEAEMNVLQSFIENPVQTNDVGRSGSLLGGFALISEQTRLPLRLLEIGASGGLNLRWDHFHYEWPGGNWGDANSAARLQNVFVEGAPDFPSELAVIERAGCDPLPVDINEDSGARVLLSYIWADHTKRIQQSKAAIEIARTVPCIIEKANGADWLERVLRNPVQGAATVVFQSTVWQYISESEQQRIVEIIEQAGERASTKAPLAWLRMEPANNRWEVQLRIYPGFQEQVIATTRPHAPAVRWLYQGT